MRTAVRAFFREALGLDEPLGSPRARFGLLAASLGFAAVEAYLSLARHATFHARTFDLAFYARMAWGTAHFDGWNPIVGASRYGLHLVWIDYLLGPLGALLGTVPVLLVAQSLALGLAALPLARVGARHLGPHGAALGAGVFLLHPNLSHVGALDFHPGTFAVLPLALVVDALDRRSWPGVLLGALGVLVCREDLGLVTMLAGLVLAARSPGAPRVAGLVVAALSLGYVAFFSVVLLPRYGPATGSLDAHFGHWGASVPEVLGHLLTHPGELTAHLFAPERLAYLPTIVAPLALLSFAAPELLVVAAPVLAVCLLSRFPTTLFLDSHYLTPALPVLVGAALVGAGRVRRYLDPRAPLVLAAVTAHFVGGADPLSLGFDPHAYVVDRDTPTLAAMVDAVGPTASVQAPDRVLAHFAERLDLRRSPPPETRADFVLLDTGHRRRFHHDEDLLRADEETLVRAWLSREDHAVVLGSDAFVLLRRGDDPRTSAVFTAAVTPGAEIRGASLTRCLALVSARLEERTLVLSLVAREACPSDLALRIGVGFRPRRVDLLADGLVSPAHLRAGDLVTSRHALRETELAAIRRDGLRVGALRESGARPEHDDPPAIDVVVEGL